jgi:thiamine-phosphate diphosphorylase
MIPVVHAVTNDAVVIREQFLPQAERVLGALGERGAIHLRAPRLASRLLQTLAEQLAAVQQRTGGWLVVCDRVDIALLTDARGIQLTSKSVGVREARRLAPTRAIGASVHTADDWTDATDGGADWVVAAQALDPVAGSDGHLRGLRLLRALAPGSATPVIGIGGIRPADVSTLRDAGAHGVAVIRGIWEASDAEAAAIDYLSAYDAHGGA